MECNDPEVSVGDNWLLESSPGHAILVEEVVRKSRRMAGTSMIGDLFEPEDGGPSIIKKATVSHQ